MTTHADRLFGRGRRPIVDEHCENPPADSEPSQASTTATGGGKVNELALVWEALNKMEAEIVKGRLESEGIPAIIRGEVLGSIVGLTTGSLAATDVLVPAPLAEKALELLNSEIVWEEVDDGTDK